MKNAKFKIGDWVLDEHLDWYQVIGFEAKSPRYMSIVDIDGDQQFDFQDTEEYFKARPIIFSTDMVRAILEGRKTQTRRIVKYDIPDGTTKIWHDGGEWIIQDAKGRSWDGKPLSSPYGESCDILYVRETFSVTENGYTYRADHDGVMADAGFLAPWKPSIHMPREAARLFLKIEEVRVELLCDISEADAVAEGIVSGGDWQSAPSIGFSNLWDEINGKRAPWESNPWVWVVTFSKINNT